MPVVEIYVFEDEAALNSSDLNRGHLVGTTDSPGGLNGILTSFPGHPNYHFAFFSNGSRLESLTEAIGILEGNEPLFTIDDLELL